ncbi:MAG: sugar ABC transporter permease [Firmicutes bacterium]|nr:sugar ABC transporter permease [Bacillota bacterium]
MSPVERIKAIDAKKRFVMAVLIPTILFFLFFNVIPIFYAFYISFHEMDFLNPPKFVALDNYKALIGDTHLTSSLLVTAKFAVTTVFIGGAFALFFALLINSVKRGQAILRTVYFLPVMTSLVAVGVIWGWLYQPRFGLLNEVLKLFGIPRQMWLSSPTTALPSAIAASIWQGMGYTIVIFLAGLNAIPESYYEAAQVDGANTLQKTWYITLPLLRPTFVYLLITGFITGFQVFDQLYVMKGPLNSTRGFIELLYTRAFSYYQMGRASAMAFLLFAIIVTLTLIQFKIVSRNQVEH